MGAGSEVVGELVDAEYPQPIRPLEFYLTMLAIVRKDGPLFLALAIPVLWSID